MTHEKYQGNMESRLGELGQQIDGLTKEAENTTDDMKQMYYENIDTLYAKQSEMQEKLKELKNSSGEAWEDIKSGMEKTWDDVQGIFKKAGSHFS